MSEPKKELTEVQKIQKCQSFVESNFSKISATFPKHLRPERMLRVYLTEISKTPKLAQCTPMSLIGALVQSGQLGLEPGNGLGHCYLLPYDNHKDGTTIAQFIIGYKGMIDLARRSGNIVSISAQAVFENDLFEFEYGIDEKLKHIPARGERGVFIGAYAVAKLVGGGYQFEVMFKGDIDKIRNKSKAGKYGPWNDHYEEMAKKTVVRRLFKMLPSSVEMQTAVTLDEAADREEQSKMFQKPEEGFLVDHETGEILQEQTVTQADQVASEI